MSIDATRDSILGAMDLNFEELEIEEWNNQTVYVWEMTGDEFSAYQAALSDLRHEISQKGKRNREVKFVAESHIHRAVVELCFLCLKDKSGVRLFTTDDQKRKLGSKSQAVLRRIYEVAERINKLDVDEEGDTPEKAEGKGSETTDSDS